MPEQQYSRADLISAFRAENPDASHIPDNKVFAAIAVEDPELAKGISELKAPPVVKPSLSPEADFYNGLKPGEFFAGLSKIGHALWGPPQGLPAGTQPNLAGKNIHTLTDANVPTADTGNAPTSIPGLDFVRNALGSGAPASRGVEAMATLGNKAGEGMTAKQAITNSPLVTTVRNVGNWLANKVDAERIFNKVAGVPAGRQGVQTDIATGEIKTQPGNAPVRAMGDASPLGQVKEAVFAKPNPELQVKVAGELHNAGQALGAKLADSKAVFDVAGDLPLGNAKLQSALKESGITPGTIATGGQEIGGGLGKSVIQVPAVPVNPTQAHALRSAIGDRINWNPTVVNDANDELKDAYFALGSKIEQNVPDVGPFNKRWQEDFLYSKALQHKLDVIGKGQAKPSSVARDALVSGLKKAGIAGGIIAGAGEAYRELH